MAGLSSLVLWNRIFALEPDFHGAVNEQISVFFPTESMSDDVDIVILSIFQYNILKTQGYISPIDPDGSVAVTVGDPCFLCAGTNRCSTKIIIGASVFPLRTWFPY